MLTKRLVWVVAGMLGCLGFVAAPARATVLVYEFEGVVDSVVDWGYILTQFVQIGDTISGTVTVDRNVADTGWPDSSTAAIYEGAVIALDGEVGDLTFSLQTPETSIVDIRNDSPPYSSDMPGPWDRYVQSAELWIPEIAEFMSLGIRLMDFSGSAFDSAMGDSIPAVMPELEAFQERTGRDQPFGFAGGGTIDGFLTRVQSVPEPGTLLVLLGIAPLLLRRGKRSSTAN